MINGKEIDWAWMDEETATYSTDYVCEIHHEKNDVYNCLGYNVKQWIAMNLNRPNGQKYSNHYYANAKLRFDEIIRGIFS